MFFFRGLIVVDLLADRIFPGEKFADKAVVDNHGPRDASKTIARLSTVRTVVCILWTEAARAGSAFPLRGNSPAIRC